MICNLYCNKIVKKSLICKTYLLKKRTNPTPSKKKNAIHNSLPGTPVVPASFKSPWWFPACSIDHLPLLAQQQLPPARVGPQPPVLQHRRPSLDLPTHTFALTTLCEQVIPKGTSPSWPLPWAADSLMLVFLGGISPASACETGDHVLHVYKIELIFCLLHSLPLVSALGSPPSTWTSKPEMWGSNINQSPDFFF